LLQDIGAILGLTGFKLNVFRLGWRFVQLSRSFAGEVYTRATHLTRSMEKVSLRRQSVAWRLGM